MARVLPDPDHGDRYTPASYLLVRTCPERRQRTVTLATIEHVARADAASNGRRPRRTLLEDEPMSHDDAMTLAHNYCDQYAVDVIYERRDEGDFTDTVIMPA